MPHELPLLREPEVRDGLRAAWLDSNPGVIGGHEEGGFIVYSKSAEKFRIVRWPRGIGDRISVPLHPNCRNEGMEIVATFHTHPNTGADFLQEPSETDRCAVRDDLNLKAEWYQGEFVISNKRIYQIDPDGQVLDVGPTNQIFESE